MKTIKQMQAEKAAYWSLNANCGITLYQAMVDVINTDGDGHEFYVPSPHKDGEYSHFLTTFSNGRVWLLRLTDDGMQNKKLMQAESDGTITIHKPTDEDDATLQNMWLQHVGVPWRVKYNGYLGWHLADVEDVCVAKYGKGQKSPFIKVYAVREGQTGTVTPVDTGTACYHCGDTLTEDKHDPALFKSGLWANYDTGYITVPCHHFCAQDEWTLADTEGPIL